MPDEFSMKRELGRKAIHLTSLIIIVVYIYFGKEIVLPFLTFALVIILSVEYLRIEWGFKVPVFDGFVREKEKNALGGEVFFIVGAFIVISVFTKEIAIAAILMTTFGDMAGSLVGKSIGRHKILHFSDLEEGEVNVGKSIGRHKIPKLRKKTVEGSTAEFFVNILMGYIVFIYAPTYLYTAAHSYPYPAIIIFAMASTATIAETAINKIDDNIFIPVFAGSAGQFLLIFFEFIKI